MTCCVSANTRQRTEGKDGHKQGRWSPDVVRSRAPRVMLAGGGGGTGGPIGRLAVTARENGRRAEWSVEKKKDCRQGKKEGDGGDAIHGQREVGEDGAARDADRRCEILGTRIGGRSHSYSCRRLATLIVHRAMF
ncbi:Hypothetical protein SMAX5B_012986 [Scophthalmus maximus]|uniref:Uncharacterized protein n=1 Tax=Scophthalmus maximus TaxID=52904 RepID=A0A2U9BM66_SCOMX|nr:Hypothetical protein SMAX5B_012986 [Scophthalmus maximus]